MRDFINTIINKTDIIMTTWGALCIRRKASYLNVLLFSILFIFNSCKIDDIGTYYTFIGQTMDSILKRMLKK